MFCRRSASQQHKVVAANTQLPLPDANDIRLLMPITSKLIVPPVKRQHLRTHPYSWRYTATTLQTPPRCERAPPVRTTYSAYRRTQLAPRLAALPFAEAAYMASTRFRIQTKHMQEKQPAWRVVVPQSKAIAQQRQMLPAHLW